MPRVPGWHPTRIAAVPLTPCKASLGPGPFQLLLHPFWVGEEPLPALCLQQPSLFFGAQGECCQLPLREEAPVGSMGLCEVLASPLTRAGRRWDLCPTCPALTVPPAWLWAGRDPRSVGGGYPAPLMHMSRPWLLKPRSRGFDSLILRST